MAKGNMFLSQARGKVGSVVFSVIKGQQVERVHNPQPANPRTYSQQAQRSLLANMTKFYKRGSQNFFKFAFEDKSSRESDFNAFARKNIMNGAYLTREQFDNDVYPALGVYTLTSGSLTHNVACVFNGDYVIIDPGANSISGTADTVTIGQISAAILTNNPALQEGDLFTFVFADSSMSIDQSVTDEVPEWNIKQFYLNPGDITKISDLGFDFVRAYRDSAPQRGVLYMQMSGIDRASFVGVVISRKTSAGLLVSTSIAQPSAVAQALVFWLRGDYAKQVSAASWGGNVDAVLEGGLLSTLPQITNVNLGQATQQASYAYASMILGKEGSSRVISITGTNIRTTAQGGKWTLAIVSAENDFEDVGRYTSNTLYTAELTATVTGAYMTLALPEDLPQWTQGYFVLSYEGVPYSYGTFIQEF